MIWGLQFAEGSQQGQFEEMEVGTDDLHDEPAQVEKVRRNSLHKAFPGNKRRASIFEKKVRGDFGHDPAGDDSEGEVEEIDQSGEYHPG